MNASYKIVLLGAFVLFAAVVGYYVLSGDGPADDNLLDDDYAQTDPTPDPTDRVEPIEPTPQPRPTLEPPAPEPEPVAEEETIGETPDELPEAPVIETLPPDGEPLAREDPTGDPTRPAPQPIEDPASEDPRTGPDETTGTDVEPRPAPQPDPAEEAVDPGTQPAPEPDAEPSPRPIPPAPATIPRTYTVQSGDTFASIATEFYGEESAWFDIAQANPSIDPKRLQVGQSIVLPNRDAAVREREEVQPPAPGNDQSYSVRPGDNLSKIAKKFYGDSEKWDLIYARNRKLIGPRPNALKVGMELVIPQAYEGAE